jgi:hypothetical protein
MAGAAVTIMHAASANPVTALTAAGSLRRCFRTMTSPFIARPEVGSPASVRSVQRPQASLSSGIHTEPCDGDLKHYMSIFICKKYDIMR